MIDQEKSNEVVGSPVLFNYSGASMHPTFKAGDGLTVLSYGSGKARPGDVVVFRPPGKESNVVHRVVRADATGIATRGDNSILDDPWILDPESIIGRVVSAKRLRRNLKVRGGRTGIMIAGMLRIRKRIALRISKALHPLYHRLSGSGILHGWLQRCMTMKILYFKKPQGTEIQLVMGKLIIGRCLPQEDSWQIRRPFRILIDTSALPKAEVIDVHKN